MKIKNADKTAMPCNSQSNDNAFGGLTKREYAAIKIMAGFASDPDTAGTVEEVSKYAVKWADALLKELEK